MKTTTLHTKRLVQALALAGLVSAASPALAAANFYLEAKAIPAAASGIGVPMWGFAKCDATFTTCDPATVPGPELTVPPGETVLNIALKNSLPPLDPADSASAEPLSIVLSGLGMPQVNGVTPPPVKVDTDLPPLSPTPRLRARSFTAETAPGTTLTYTWNDVKPGTYLYHSGTHPQLQVQMGLYGALKQNAATGFAYPVVAGKPDTSYAGEVVLLYSEVDPDLHNAVASGNYGPGKAVTSTVNYAPKHFLVNGKPYSATIPPIAAGTVGQRTLVRLLNAGLRTHVPVLNGQYLSLVAEDGKPYPYAKEQYSVMLPAFKTVDAILTPTLAGTYPIYDRRLDMSQGTPTGMLAKLTIASGGAPVATNDAYAVNEDTPLNVAAAGVLGNDTGTAPLTASLVNGVSNGTLTLNANGSFSYTPNLNFSGTDSFSYKANSGVQGSNTATASITVNPVNDAPVAGADAYTVAVGGTLNIAAPGVLANDSDVDGDQLTATLQTAPSVGTLSLQANGAFTYAAPSTIPATQPSFVYRACDPAGLCSVASASITVQGANQAPVALNDLFTYSYGNLALHGPYSVTANDKDANGYADIDQATVQIYGALASPGVYLTQRGGTARANGDGTVTYTPKVNFRGTDMFTYTVRDKSNAISNRATARINVTN